MERFSSLTKKLYLSWRIRQYMLLKKIEQKRSRRKNCFTLPRSVAGRIFDVNHVGAVVRRTRQNVMQASFAPLRGVAAEPTKVVQFRGKRRSSEATRQTSRESI